MRKILPILVVGILVLGGLGAVATSEVDTEKLSLVFSHLKLHEEADRITLELEGANSVLTRKDHYMVPMHIETFIYPFGTEIQSIEVTPKNIVSQAISKELTVAPDPVIVGQVISTKVEKTVDPMAVSTWYEYDVGTGLRDRERCVIVKVVVFPVQYHLTENMIEWAENVEIEVKYREPEQQPMVLDDQYVFIVLTPSEFSDELQSFINHKNDRGVSTKLVTLDEIYGGDYFPVQGRDNPEKIKYFIKNAIENWQTSFVLLVGGSTQFPTRTTHVNAEGDKELFVSDLYYADIYDNGGGFSSWDTNGNDVFGEYEWQGNTDDVDLYPEVSLGRLPCTSGSQLTTVIGKITTYEDNEAYTKDWFTDLVVAGGDSVTPAHGDDSGILEGEYVNQAVIDIMQGFIPDKLWASNGRLSGLAPSGTQKMIDAISTGGGFVDFSGHGNPYVWATHPFEDEGTWLPTPYGWFGHYSGTTHIYDLSNGDELPIVVTGACSISKYNKASNCFSWLFLTNPNGGGIASLGAAALGYVYLAEGSTQGLIEGLAINCFEAYKDEGAITFGEMWSTGITIYIDTHSMKAHDYKTVEEWQPFGDPTLAIGEESQAPYKPDPPSGPKQGSIGVPHKYTASTTDPDGDQLKYMFSWGDDTFSGWVPSGDNWVNSGEEVEASHEWNTQSTYEIKVKAKDKHGVQSEWSDPLEVTMPKNKVLYYTPLILRLLERFPNAFPILRYLLGL